MWGHESALTKLFKQFIMMFRGLHFVFVLGSLINSCKSIVNPANQTANMVIYLRRPNELISEFLEWSVGVNCIDEFGRIFFRHSSLETYTRAYNMVLTNVYNMSSITSQIQEGYMKRINEAVNERPPTPPRQDLYQLRVVADREQYKRLKMTIGRELLLADFYVIVVDTVPRLKSLMRNYVSKMRSWNPGGRFIVLFNNPQERNKSQEIAIEVFNELMRNFYVFRVALLFATDETRYLLMVNDYYSNVDCRILRVQSVGECRSGKLYPDEGGVVKAMSKYLAGFSPQNCTFYVCASIAAPFVEADCSEGIELRILNFLRNRLKFAINQTCEHDTRGVVDQADNWTGLLGKLNDGACDFIMGGFYPDNDVVENFWASDCYLADSHTWYVKMAELRPPWKALVSIFNPMTWICFFVILVLCWLFWYALMMALPEPEHFQELALTAINALAVSICVAINERPICQASRVYFLALSIYGLNVVCTYTSKMIETFQHPGYEHQIDEITEVVAEGIPFGGSMESRDWFENEEDMWIFDAYNDSNAFEPITVNLFAVKQGTRVILSNRMYIMQSNLSDAIFAFPNNVFSSPIQMIMKAGFPFLFEINWIIRQMRDVGIFEKIDADFRYNNTYLNRIAKMRPIFEETAIVLTTEHLQGPFAILIVGLCCASLTFCLELLLYYGLLPFRSAGKLKQRHKISKNNKGLARKSKVNWKLKRRNNNHVKEVQVFREIRFTPIKRRKVL